MNGKSQILSYSLSALLIISIVVLTLASKDIPNVITNLTFASFGVSGGVTIPRKAAELNG